MTDDLILSVVMGSRAYGLETESSDTDRRGVFVAPTAAFWRLDKPPTHRDGPLPEQFSWEVERFCRLALDANPTVLECLWSPIVEVITPAGRRLRELRTAFLSRRAQRTFGCCSAAFTWCATASRWSRWDRTASGCSRCGAVSCRGRR
ncbi:nucleotidyltransferase domain-containing protein [Nonomuraea longispora]|uniref:nucleotidyltransferase domain-containing protein n=1 Tax=Nonomuraea longispora TaxID=1848320 RepID=UPI001FEC0CD6|nr:nucleotidyltransferase domain-containing protein [Nonomuraea longispora]